MMAAGEAHATMAGTGTVDEAVCRLCRGVFVACGKIPKYVAVREGEKLFRDFDLRRCTGCGSLKVSISDGEMLGHLHVASYTDPKNESRFLSAREEYFRWLAREHLRDVAHGSSVLDFGSSYGHFVAVLAGLGYQVTGLEIVDPVRSVAASNYPGARFLSALDDLRGEEGSFAAAFLIDSLYCCPDPLAIVNRVRELLMPGGLLVARLTNRIWYWKLNHLLGRKVTEAILGDSRWIFSSRGAVRLLEQSGMREIRIRYWERGKRMSWRKSAGYHAMGLLGDLSRGRLALTPGMIVSCRK